MYGIQLPDLPEEGEWKTIQRREYTLYLTGTNHTELPGFYVIAKSNDLSDPPWGWEEYRTWSPEKQANAFGAYYDQKYGDLSILNESACPFKVENFDHRESAQEAGYGRWLNKIPRRGNLDEHLKGMLIQIPLTDCPKLLSQLPDNEEKLTVIVGDRDQVNVTFHVDAVDTWVDYWFF